MPARVNDDVRAAIAADLRANPDDTFAAVARRHGVGPTLVRTIARVHGLAAPVGTAPAQTENATRQAVALLAKRRAALAVRLQDTAERLLDSLTEPHVAFNFGGKDNTYAEHAMAQPDVKAAQTIMTTIAIAVDKQLALLKHDAGGDGTEAASLLDRLGTALVREFGDGGGHREEWQPAGPGDTPGELVPGEIDLPQPVDL